MSVTCTDNKGANPTTHVLTSTEAISVCRNFQVLSSAAYTIGTISNSGLQTEQTRVSFPSVAAGASATILFGSEADTYSYTCSYKTTGKTTTYTVTPAACP